MITISEVIEEMRDFSLFQDVLMDVLQFEHKITSKLWTLEILTSYMNDLIERFLSSKDNRINVFFAKYLHKKFEKSRSRQKYCFTLMLSLLFFRRRYYYIGILFFNF